jgi:stress-induced morphogen
MALQIGSSPSSAPDGEATARDLRDRITEAYPDASVEVNALSPGHFEIRVVSSRFEGLSRVKQQQGVYAAIAPLLKGDAAPVHAIDRLQTELP